MMRFRVIESTFNMQGTAKAFAVSDSHKRTYFIPRSQIKIVERIEAENEFDMAHLIIDVPNWIIRNNQIPIFNLTEMFLER